MRSPHRIVLLVSVALLTAAQLGGSQPTNSGLRVLGAPTFKGVVYKFFDDHTGYCTGQLKIGRIDMEYRRQGFMRVAWRPLVVLEQVELDVSENLAWPAQGSQISRELQVLGGQDELVLRDVRIRLAAEAGRVIAAPAARFLPGNVLELSEATDAPGGDATNARVIGTVRLHLTGPNAGRLSVSVPPRPSSVLSQISP